MNDREFENFVEKWSPFIWSEANERADGLEPRVLPDDLYQIGVTYLWEMVKSGSFKPDTEDFDKWFKWKCHRLMIDECRVHRSESRDLGKTVYVDDDVESSNSMSDHNSVLDFWETLEVVNDKPEDDEEFTEYVSRISNILETPEARCLLFEILNPSEKTIKQYEEYKEKSNKARGKIGIPLQIFESSLGISHGMLRKYLYDIRMCTQEVIPSARSIPVPY